MADSARDRHSLELREAQLDELEMELAFEDARLRGREHALGSQREALAQRAGWLDERERTLIKAAGDAATHLTGLGAGGAAQELDIEGFVARSSTLYVGRAAMVAAREEMLVRRQQLVQSRRTELASYEEAFTRAEVRLAARERLVNEAAVQTQRKLATGAATGLQVPGHPTSSGVVVPEVPSRSTVRSDAVQQPSLPSSRPSSRRIVARPSFQPAEGRITTEHPLDGGATVEPSVADAPVVAERPADPQRPALPPRRATGQSQSTRKPHDTAPQPRTRVVVDAVSDVTDPRHAETIGFPIDALPPAGASGALAPSPLSPPDLPADLPDAPHNPARHALTEQLAATVSLEGIPLLRSQLELDRGSETLLVSFSGHAPPLSEMVTLVSRGRDATVRSFSLRVRRMMAAPPRGSVVVLTPLGWSSADFEAFERVLGAML